MPDRFLYIFLDESGNLDFSKNGSRFFLITGVVQERPFEAYKALCDLRYDLIESGDDIQRFHASPHCSQIPVPNQWTKTLGSKKLLRESRMAKFRGFRDEFSGKDGPKAEFSSGRDKTLRR